MGPRNRAPFRGMGHATYHAEAGGTPRTGYSISPKGTPAMSISLPTSTQVPSTHRLPRQRTELTEALDALATDLDGILVRPGDANWDSTRAAWNLHVDQSPTAVVVAETVRDVVCVVNTAR